MPWLKPSEYKRYIFAIFDLQRFFTESFAPTMPEAPEEEKMDEFFIRQVCRPDSDEHFWAGMVRNGRVSEYLVRYLIMYFDYAFPARSGFQEYLRDYMDSRRRFTPPRSGRRVSLSAAATVFGISRAELSALGRKELKKLFKSMDFISENFLNREDINEKELRIYFDIYQHLGIA